MADFIIIIKIMARDTDQTNLHFYLHFHFIHKMSLLTIDRKIEVGVFNSNASGSVRELAITG